MTGIKLNDRSHFELVSGLWKGDKGQLALSKVLRSTNFAGDGLLDFGDVAQLEVEQRHFAKRRLQHGDIIIERSGGGPKQAVGRAAFFDARDDGAYFSSNFTTAIRVLNREVFDPEYVALRLHAIYMEGTTEALQRATTGIRNLDWNEYLQFSIPVISLAAQKDLVKLFNLARSAYRNHDKLGASLVALKQATMRELFTCGLSARNQKETEIGLLPENWEPRTVHELCEIWSGGTPRKSVAEYWSGDVPWVSGKDLKHPALDDAIDHISLSGVQQGSRLAPKGAVLLLVRGMGLARDLPVAVINRSMAFNQDVKALVSRGQYSGQFLRSAIYAGKQRLLSQIVPSAHGTMTLNLNDVENFKLACPSDPEEAKEIATILETLDRKISLHKQKRKALESLFRGLLHKWMAGDIQMGDVDSSRLDPEVGQ